MIERGGRHVEAARCALLKDPSVLIRHIVVVCVLMFVVGLRAGSALADEGCTANASIRSSQQTSFLPNCRAYELVTPSNPEGDEPKAIVVGLKPASLQATVGAVAAEDGERFAWVSEYVFPESSAPGLDYLSKRTGTGWTSENVIPPQSVESGVGCPLVVGIAAYSDDLSRGILADGFGQPGSFRGELLDCGHDEPALTSGETQGFQNLFLRDNDNASFQLIDVAPPGTPAPKPPLAGKLTPQFFPAAFLAGSSNLDTVVFEEELPLTPGAPPEGIDLYSWQAGKVALVTVLPNDEQVVGTLASSTRNVPLEELTGKFVPFNFASHNNAVSADGHRIFFEADGNLYLREDGVRTFQIDESQGLGLGGDGKFMYAAADGSRVFFSDAAAAGLTTNTLPGSGQNLYEYDVYTRDLTDLTAVATADFAGFVGGSSDGSYTYFVADGVLPGSEAGPTGGQSAKPTVGQPNLYVRHNGETSFIATLSETSDSCDWLGESCIAYPELGSLSARVPNNGLFLAFDSAQSLTGYNNTGSECVPVLVGGSSASTERFAPGRCREIYLYETLADRLACVSCRQDGLSPTGPAIIRFAERAGTSEEMRNTYPSRNVSESGQVFYESPDPLVPEATNGRLNVYEYEHGNNYLISSGSGESDAVFLDASRDGSNIFFATASPLLGRTDADSAYSIYDARVGGGFPEPSLTEATCQGESCRSGVAGVPIFVAPSSFLFTATDVVPSVKTGKKSVKVKKKSVKIKKNGRKRKRKAHPRTSGKRRSHRSSAAKKKSRKRSSSHRGAK